MAIAGEDESMHLGVEVTLDGGASSVSDGGEPICIWTLEHAPAGSSFNIGDLILTDPCKPSFTPAFAGSYTFGLTVTDSCGQVSPADSVKMTVTNEPPVAHCELVGDAIVGQTAVLDGSGSSDPEGDPLQYSWNLSRKPSGSTVAFLEGADTVSASFVPSCAGDYVVALAVNDGAAWSENTFCTVTVAPD